MKTNMNKQEAIEKIKKQSVQAYDDFAIMRDTAIYIVNQLNEPEKPVVPQYVADWLEKNDWRKDTSGSQTIFDVFDNLTLDASNGFYADVKKWVEENDNIFAKAWLFGYEVEKEKLYTVEIPNPNDGERPVLFKNRDGKVSIIFPSVPCWREVKNAQLTESEIKQDFEWAWQFAKEVEGK